MVIHDTLSTLNLAKPEGPSALNRRFFSFLHPPRHLSLVSKISVNRRDESWPSRALALQRSGTAGRDSTGQIVIHPVRRTLEAEPDCK
jgi:hypothetical protein